GFQADRGHGGKLARWLRADPANTLVVLAYDDRYIEYEGKRVVSETGGTYRATLERLVPALEVEGLGLERTESDDWIVYTDGDVQVDIRVHKNPDNLILHTVLVGEMNGFIHAMTCNTEQENPGILDGRRVYPCHIREGQMKAE